MNDLMKALPPGAIASDVADDIDIKASEGEFIVPANVVRFIGLDKLRSMVEKAEIKLGDMENEGRSTDEEGVPEFAEGGLVTNPLADTGFSGVKTYTDGTGRSLKIPVINGEPVIPVPAGFSENNTAQAQVAAAPAPQQERPEGASTGGKGVTGMAGAVDQWSAQDFSNYSKQRNTAVEGFGYGVVQALGGPMGKAMAQNRKDYLNAEVPTAIDKMLKDNLDINGKALSNEQRAELERVRNELSQPEQPGPLAGVKEALTSPIKNAVTDFWNNLTGRTSGPMNATGIGTSTVGKGFTYGGNSQQGKAQLGSNLPSRTKEGGDGTGGGVSKSDKDNAHSGNGGLY